MTDEQKPAPPRRSWLQFSLGTLLALVLGIGIGLAVKSQIGDQPGRLPSPPPVTLPDPSNIRLGEKVTVEVTGNVPAFKRTALVLADGTISLPNLGQVPAAGLSLEALTADLQQRYGSYYRTVVQNPNVLIFVSFADSSVGN